jgi:Protein of unknown function (DUF2934)
MNRKTIKPKKTEQYKSVPTIKTPALPPNPDEIRQRAHEIFIARGGGHGQDLDDWLKAESELKGARAQE